MDCIKSCPMHTSIWALAYYQQNPEFLGGIMVVSTSTLIALKNIDCGNDTNFL